MNNVINVQCFLQDVELQPEEGLFEICVSVQKETEQVPIYFKMSMSLNVPEDMFDYLQQAVIDSSINDIKTQLGSSEDINYTFTENMLQDRFIKKYLFNKLNKPMYEKAVNFYNQFIKTFAKAINNWNIKGKN